MLSEPTGLRAPDGRNSSTGGCFARIIPTFGSSGNTEFCASTPWIVLALFIPRKDWFLGEYFKPLVIAKGFLDATVFKGMKTDDAKPAAHSQAGWHPSQGDLQGFQFLVDGNPQGLECSRGGIDLPLLSGARNCSAYDLGQLACRLNWLLSSSLDNRPGNPSAVPFLTVGEDQVGEVLCLEPIHQPGGRLAAFRIESQIERSIGSETETSGLVRQLITRQTEIEKHAVNAVNLELFKGIRQIGEIGVHHGDGQIAQRLASTFDCFSIPIERYDSPLGADEPCQSPRMPTSAHRAIHQHGARPWFKPLDDFIEKYRNVDGMAISH